METVNRWWDNRDTLSYTEGSFEEKERQSYLKEQGLSETQLQNPVLLAQTRFATSDIELESIIQESSFRDMIDLLLAMHLQEVQELKFEDLKQFGREF